MNIFLPCILVDHGGLHPAGSNGGCSYLGRYGRLLFEVSGTPRQRILDPKHMFIRHLADTYPATTSRNINTLGIGVMCSFKFKTWRERKPEAVFVYKKAAVGEERAVIIILGN